MMRQCGYQALFDLHRKPGWPVLLQTISKEASSHLSGHLAFAVRDSWSSQTDRLRQSLPNMEFWCLIFYSWQPSVGSSCGRWSNNGVTIKELDWSRGSTLQPTLNLPLYFQLRMLAALQLGLPLFFCFSLVTGKSLTGKLNVDKEVSQLREKRCPTDSFYLTQNIFRVWQ